LVVWFAPWASGAGRRAYRSRRKRDYHDMRLSRNEYFDIFLGAFRVVCFVCFSYGFLML
jgi:hypothetical protein